MVILLRRDLLLLLQIDASSTFIIIIYHGLRRLTHLLKLKIQRGSSSLLLPWHVLLRQDILRTFGRIEARVPAHASFGRWRRLLVLLVMI